MDPHNILAYSMGNYYTKEDVDSRETKDREVGDINYGAKWQHIPAYND